MVLRDRRAIEESETMLQQPHCPVPEFSIAEARRIVQDLFEPKPWIYWTDFLLSISVGGASFASIRRSIGWTSTPWLQVALPVFFFVVATLALYRSALFTHELTHLRKGSFRAFRVVWNLFCGIPLLMPSFLYHTHVSHHMRRHYGTPHDGEYLPFASSPVRHIFLYLGQSFIIPLLAILRFLILSPLAWVSPSLRQWMQQHASSMVIDPSYVRPLPTRQELGVWRLQEVACFLMIVGAIAALVLGVVPWVALLQIYAVAVTVIMLNALRTLGAHRYHQTGEEVTFVEQLVDSVNYPRHPVMSGLWAPVGLRFHALHHLFPSMPYHALAEAHGRLMAHLPADSPYRQTESPGLWASLSRLIGEAREAARGTREEASTSGWSQQAGSAS